MWRDAHIRYLEAAFRSEGGKLARARVADLVGAGHRHAEHQRGQGADQRTVKSVAGAMAAVA